MELTPPSLVQSDELATKDLGALGAPLAAPTATSIATAIDAAAIAIAIDARTSTNVIRCCSQMFGHCQKHCEALAP